MAKIVKLLIVLLFYATSLFCSGCGDVEWLWSKPKPGRSDRSARTIQPTQKPESTKAKTTNTTSKQEPAAVPTASKEETGYYQLILHSEPAQTRTQPGIKHIHLRKAPARSVGELLGILYLPAGPTGTEHRYTLIYATPVEWGAAVSWIEALDVMAIKDTAKQTADNIENEFAYGAGLMNSIPEDVSDDDKRFRLAREIFSRTAQSVGQAEHLRWASGMIAGSISACRLHKYGQAEKDYATAEAVAKPGSLEQMNARYERACMMVQNGKVKDARKMLANLIDQFGNFKKAEAYQRAGRALDGLKR